MKVFCVLLSCILLTGCSTNGVQDVGSSPTSTPADTYDETYRPQVHYSPPTQWMNDPNGMVYFEGEYHLFYQYYPDSNVWGPMHWGHAVSPDLLEWENLPIALYPDSLGWIFSGSAVVDHDNTSGLGTDDQPPLVAIFTYHNDPLEKAGRDDFQYQGIAYSTDRGRTWTKYAGNPVVPNEEPIRDFRDPKVIWDAEREQWLMVFAAQDHVMFWRSDNLIDWEHLSDFGKTYGAHGGVWECPDIFPLQVEGSDETKWVLLLSINPGGPNGGSATQYFVGDFDGTDFTLDPDFATEVSDSAAVWLDYGRDNYAGVTWSDVPKEDGRRIFIGWMSNWDYARDVPTTVWRSAMTVPRTLSLQQTAEGYRLFSNPIAELTQLRGAPEMFHGEPSLELTTASGAHELELVYALDESVTTPFGVALRNAEGDALEIGYDPERKAFYSDRRGAGANDFADSFAPDRTWAPRLSSSDTLRMHLIFDRASVELFADGGSTVVTEIFFPIESLDQLTAVGDNPVIEGTSYPLRSIWKE
ncbi:Levanase [Neolewinella maritima]|uniref:Levanase n=1 Tax=Neolewinella maritima TaxID=1383882 RepID=A0ABM9B193_9BACT|nr:glycoside hydrolase family 32 protein [Neolewinella maritima]CAH1001040.1 Levanase [Neolewinella maritima]